MPSLAPDKPLTDPSEDRLGYEPFAKRLAESILNMIPPEGLVIAIHGQWGSGKTTCVEFIAYYLENNDDDVSPAVIRFNPWWFSGSEDLVKHFFDELEDGFRKNFRKGAKSIVAGVQRLSRVVSKIPVPGAGIAQEVAAPISNLLDRSVHQIKAICLEVSQRNGSALSS